MANEDAKNEVQEGLQVVAFKLHDEEYGVSILNVQEIRNLTDITISKDVLERWLAVKGWSYEDFMETYTAEDTMDLVYWLMDSGFGFEIPGKEKYRYGMLHRPFSIGCQPKEGFVYRQKSKNQRYHDIIWYNRPLTEKELADYELEKIA